MAVLVLVWLARRAYQSKNKVRAIPSSLAVTTYVFIETFRVHSFVARDTSCTSKHALFLALLYQLYLLLNLHEIHDPGGR